MSCSYNIRLKLFTGSQADGTLSYIGYSSTVNGTYGSGGSSVPPPNGDTLILDVTGFIVGYYKFKYEGIKCGIPVSETAIMQVVQKSNAGNPNTYTFCVNDTQNTNLNSLITGETLGGTWSVNPASQGTDADIALNGNYLDLSLMTTPGTYYFDYSTGLIGAQSSYELSDCVGCYDSNLLTIIIAAPSNAGTGGSIASCVGCSINLFDYLSLADPNGTWQKISGPACTITGGYLGTVNPQAGTYTFRYTVGFGTCIDTEDITLVTHPAANAGTGSTSTVCSDVGTTIDLYNKLTGEQVGGYWTIEGSAPQIGFVDLANGTYTPAVGDSGTFTFRYHIVFGGTLGECTANCEDHADVIITVNDSGYAGENTGAYGCISDLFNITALIQAASPNPISTGQVWFLGYASACTGNNASGIFSANGAPATTHQPMTNFGASLSITNIQGWGCYQFMHYTPNQGATCQDTAFVEITIGACCLVDFALNFTSGQICISGLTNCGNGVPDNVDWFYSQNGTNYTLIAGANGANCITPTQGNGTYKAEVTCGSCVHSEYYPYSSPCTVSASISEANGVLTANTTGCSGAENYQWQYSPTGTGNWTVIGSSQTQAANQGDGHYKVIISCPDGSGCQAIDTYIYSSGCALTVTVTESNGVITANASGGTPPYTYQWQFSTTGANGTYTNISGATGQTYTPVQSGFFNVIVNDNASCTAEDDISYTLPSCNTSVTLSTINNGADIQATVSGTSNPVTRWQYSPSGSGWISLAQFDDLLIITPDQGNGHYRCLLFDGVVGNCPAQDTIIWNSLCTGSVIIAQQTCGATDVDYIFLIDSSNSISSSEYGNMKSNIQSTIDALDANPSINPRWMIVHYGSDKVFVGSACASHHEWDHKIDITVNWTTDANTAKSFSRPSMGGFDFLNESMKELYDTVLAWRAGADRHLVIFSDALRDSYDSFIVNANQDDGECYNISTIGPEPPFWEYADTFKNTGNTTISFVRYRQSPDTAADEAAASVASQGGSYNGIVESGAPTPRRLYQLTFGDPLPDLPYEVSCTQLTSTITGCSGAPVYTWQVSTNGGTSWSNLPQNGSTIDITQAGSYRLLISCGGCSYTSNTIVIA